LDARRQEIDMIRHVSLAVAAFAVVAGLLLSLGGADGGTAHAQQPLPPVEAPLPPVPDREVRMFQGANLVVCAGPTTDVAEGLNNILDDVLAVWSFEAPVQTWFLWAPALPAFAQGFDVLEGGRAYFVIVSAAGVWVFPAGRPLPEMPPLVFLTVSDQVFLPERGSYCWPSAEGPGICADTFFPPMVDTFSSLEGGPVDLHWDPPPPDSFTAQLLDPTGEPTSFSMSFENAGDGQWFPEAPAGDYILQVSGVWRSLPGEQSGDAQYFFGIRLDQDGGFPTVEVEAPILSVSSALALGGYVLTIEFGLPNGCHEFASIEFDASGETPVVTLLNTAPAPNADVACIEIFGMETRTIDMGALNPSTVIVNGTEYPV